MEWFVWEIACLAVICDLCVEKCNFKRPARSDLISHCHQPTQPSSSSSSGLQFLIALLNGGIQLDLLLLLLLGRSCVADEINAKIMNNKSQKEHDFYDWQRGEKTAHCLSNTHTQSYTHAQSHTHTITQSHTLPARYQHTDTAAKPIELLPAVTNLCGHQCSTSHSKRS